jgi:hypothetical protein
MAEIAHQVREPTTKTTSRPVNNTGELGESKVEGSGTNKFPHGNQQTASTEPTAVTPSKKIDRHETGRRRGRVAMTRAVKPPSSMGLS